MATGYSVPRERTWADIAESTGLSPAILRRIRSTFLPYLGLDPQGYPGENTERVVRTIMELKRSGMEDKEIADALKGAFSEGAGWPQEILSRMQSAASASLTAREVLELVSGSSSPPEPPPAGYEGQGSQCRGAWGETKQSSQDGEPSIRESLFDFRREMRLYFIRAREQQDRLESQLANLAAEMRELRFQLGLNLSRKDRKNRGKA